MGDKHTGRMVRDAYSKDRIDTTALFQNPAETTRSDNIKHKDGRRQLRLDNLDIVEHQEDEIALAIFLGDEQEDLIARISGFLWGVTLEIDYLWLSNSLPW